MSAPGAVPPALPEAWLVIASDGFRAVFIDRAVAERYAVQTHGTVHPLVRSAA